MLAYGEDRAIQDASEAGANGFIMVDLPPEEAITFRKKCTQSKYDITRSLYPVPTLISDTASHMFPSSHLPLL